MTTKRKNALSAATTMQPADAMAFAEPAVTDMPQAVQQEAEEQAAAYRLFVSYTYAINGKQRFGSTVLKLGAPEPTTEGDVAAIMRAISLQLADGRDVAVLFWHPLER